MSFLKTAVNATPIEDTVFAVVKKAKQAKEMYGKDAVIDATIGALADENGKLVAFDTVYQSYNEISNEEKANYASSFIGNDSYRKAIYDWVFEHYPVKMPHTVVATPGGTGAVDMVISQCLDQNETVILPELGWGSYSLMAEMAQLQTLTYQMFEEDHFHMENFKQVCLEVMKKQERLVIVINDPCHNPTGYSLSFEEWQEMIHFLNECSKTKEIVLLNDIAYLDYSYDLTHNTEYVSLFQTLSDRIMVVIAFSCSKTLTAYGMRCGGALVLAKEEQKVQEVEHVFEKIARAKWSNISNSAMINFVKIATLYKDEFLKEKQYYIDLLKRRSDAFLSQAKQVDLPCYPYKEGFFVTVKMENNEQRNKFHEALMQQHIYTVKVNKGIRIAICSLNYDKCQILASRMKEILKQLG